MLKRRHRSDWRVRQNYDPGTRARAEKLALLTLTAVWPGRSGETDRRVFFAHVCLQHASTKHTYGASIREVAKIAGVWPATVDRAHDRLVDAGLLVRVRPGDGPRSTLWRTASAATTTLSASSIIGCSTPEVVLSLILHPAFRHGSGLNGTVWLALSPTEETPRGEIAMKTGKSPATISKLLAASRKKGLAERGKDGWLRRGDTATLDQIATDSGAFDRRDKLVQTMSDQQSSYRSSWALGLSRKTEVAAIRDAVIVFLNTKSDWAFNRLMRMLDEIRIAKSINDLKSEIWASDVFNAAEAVARGRSLATTK